MINEVKTRKKWIFNGKTDGFEYMDISQKQCTKMYLNVSDLIYVHYLFYVCK